MNFNKLYLRNYLPGELVAVLNKAIKVTFSIVGAITGFTLTNTLLSYQNIKLGFNYRIFLFSIISLLIALAFYSTGSKIIEITLDILDKLEKLIQKMTLSELAISLLGLIAGLVIANLITIPINKIDVIGVPLSIVANILFGCVGIYITLGKKNDSIFGEYKGKNNQFRTEKSNSNYKLLDTSVIIDGRILDICRTGFLEGELIIPSFVLEELRHIADSSDSLKRSKGRRGLDVLNILQKELEHPVKIENIEINDGSEVDDKLLKAAKSLNAQVITIDYNLNKVASFQGISVLNINDLANAVKPIALPGEEMNIQVIKDGKESGQGIGYLNDGTMIVVEGGRRHVGEVINVTVTSILQTSAGRMIFAKPKYGIERVI